ncbi:MAG TPA: hypothetical protein VGX52_10480, partial [Burkholderiales bacterium]|nr:hypothetical protein [Burkholderiales bacterium]
MISRWIGVGLLALAPVATLAFETVDELPFPSLGRFPAWAADPIRPWSVFAYGGLMYDNNAFRRDTGEESDIVARYGAGGSYLARVVGRQRVALDGYGEYYDYDQ